jgi:hypothetical protein
MEAECRYEAPCMRLKARPIALLEDPTDPFDPGGQRPRERGAEYLRRIA